MGHSPAVEPPPAVETPPAVEAPPIPPACAGGALESLLAREAYLRLHLGLHRIRPAHPLPSLRAAHPRRRRLALLLALEPRLRGCGWWPSLVRIGRDVSVVDECAAQLRQVERLLATVSIGDELDVNSRGALSRCEEERLEGASHARVEADGGAGGAHRDAGRQSRPPCAAARRRSPRHRKASCRTLRRPVRHMLRLVGASPIAS